MTWERLVAVLALVLGGLALVLSLSLPKTQGPGPELFPRILGAVLVLAGMRQLFQTGTSRLQEGLESLPLSLKLFLFFLAAPLLVPRIGLAPSAALAAGLGAFLAGESLLRSLLVAVFTGLLAYCVFVRLLGVSA